MYSDDIDIVFGPKDTQVVTNISIKNDTHPEMNETFIITMIITPDMKAIGVKNGPYTNSTCTIINDDCKL